MTPREILEETKRRVLADPTSYAQDSFCGTQCCIAGQIDIIVNGLDVHIGRNMTRRENISEIEWVALDALGESAEIWLFGSTDNADDAHDDEYDEYEESPEYWPRDLSKAYEDAGGTKGRAEVACRAIDRYMAERGI